MSKYIQLISCAGARVTYVLVRFYFILFFLNNQPTTQANLNSTYCYINLFPTLKEFTDSAK